MAQSSKKNSSSYNKNPKSSNKTSNSKKASNKPNAKTGNIKTKTNPKTNSSKKSTTKKIEPKKSSPNQKIISGPKTISTSSKKQVKTPRIQANKQNLNSPSVKENKSTKPKQIKPKQTKPEQLKLQSKDPQKEVQINTELEPIKKVNQNKEIKKGNKRKINLGIYYTFLIIYLEALTKIFIVKNPGNLLYTLLFSLPFILILYIISNLFKAKGNKIISIISSFIITFYYVFQCIFFRLFSVLFSFNSLGMAGNVIEFKDMAINAVIKNLSIIVIYFLPFILLIVLQKKVNFTRAKIRNIILSFGFTLLIFGISLFSIRINKKEIYSAYNLYYNINNEIKTTEELGLLTMTRLDIKRLIFGFDATITNYQKPVEIIENIENNVPEEPTIPITYNEINIDFDELINNETNNTIKKILNYFKTSNPTNKNTYTGMFKDKNVIFILAEGFNMIAVDPELTPTLYKLTHEGFVFNNFYSPVFLSTTGGEFQAMTGLIPTQEVLSNWKKYTPTIKYALGHSFNNIGYKTESYHNWTYTYYNRNKTMPTLGFNDYMGCGNGLNKLMSCSWLPSDVDMINVTLPLYSDYARFATYYVSVSGHAPYNFGGGNSNALKHKELVKNLPYSNSVKAYLASQIEFDRAIEALIKGLEEKGILQDTVIAFAGDHYPYTLSIDEINEVSDYKRDEIVEVNHSNFVIWNSEMSEPVIVDKVGSQIDILPTLLNLFGIEYDSRLIIGKDILSDEPGLAIFSNRSWVSDYGTYKNGKFTLKDGEYLENINEYVNYINNQVSNKFTISNQIIKYKMYDYILK